MIQNNKTVLLASFVDRNDIDATIKKIKENFVIAGSKVFILNQKDDDKKVIITYNILIDDNKAQFDKHIQGTISLHRKKETNTLYTLNALNEIVKSENNGKLDKNFQINWKNYANCILINQKNKGLVKFETELDKILNLENIG